MPSHAFHLGEGSKTVGIVAGSLIVIGGLLGMVDYSPAADRLAAYAAFGGLAVLAVSLLFGVAKWLLPDQIGPGNSMWTALASFCVVTVGVFAMNWAEQGEPTPESVPSFLTSDGASVMQQVILELEKAMQECSIEISESSQPEEAYSPVCDHLDNWMKDLTGPDQQFLEYLDARNPELNELLDEIRRVN